MHLKIHYGAKLLKEKEQKGVDGKSLIRLKQGNTTILHNLRNSDKVHMTKFCDKR
jgi:hypothetical protein